MAWTTPRTWIVDENVTATIMNTHVRDNENYLFYTRGSVTLGLAAASSNSIAVTHGFGATPASVLLTFAGAQPIGAGAGVGLWVTAVGATTFTVNIATDNGGAATVSFTIYWMAC